MNLKRPSEINNCVECSIDISHLHGRTIRCKPCAKEYRNEYLRMYMAKRYLRERQSQWDAYTENDISVVNNQHMIGKGTFLLPRHSGDFKKEYETIFKLRKMIGLVK